MAKYGRFDSNNKKKHRDKFRHEVKKSQRVDRDRDSRKKRIKNLSAHSYVEE